MKKCPFCKAQIEDNAVFCLYCMNSLEDKKSVDGILRHRSRIPVILAAVLLFIILAVFSVFFFDYSSCADGETPTISSSRDETEVSSTALVTDISPDSSVVDSTINNTQASVGNSQGSDPHNVTNHTVNTTENVSENREQGNEKPQTSVVETTPQAPVISTKPQENIQDAPPVEDKPSVSYVSYTYRQAQRGDDFSANYPFSSDEIVITGVSGTSSGGEYVIPSQIDGKTVIAIMPLSFSGNSVSGTVKSVIVPSTVKTIWGNAFHNCTNLTDIYFCGKSIYTETTAFPDPQLRTGTLTIHCAYDCSDRNLRYYRNSASYYGAIHKTWNGGV